MRLRTPAVTRQMSSKTNELKAVKMSAGKAAAQASHATLGAYRRGMRHCPQAVRDWLRIGQMKMYAARSSPTSMYHPTWTLQIV